MVFSVRSYWRQWQAGLSLSFSMLVIGFAKGWISPYIAQLTTPDSTDALKLSPSEASWIASLLFLGRLFGNVVGATIQEFIGRKKTLLYSSAPLAVGWVLTIIATSVPWLYASRLLCGVSMGMILSAISPFLGEIADPKIRGSMVVCNMNMMLIGQFLGNTMGTFLSMEIFSYMSLAVTGLFVVLFAFVPESPHHYIAIGDIKKAEESLQWYTRDVDVRKELCELQEFISSTSMMSLMKRLNEFKKPEHRRNLIIMSLLNIFIFGAGANTMSAYCEIILINSKVSLKPSIIVMVLSFSTVVVGFLAMILIDKFGRRPLLIISGFGVCASQVFLGLHFHMLSLNVDPTSISWLPVVAMFFDFCLMGCGLGMVPHALIGELFPPILKTPATLVFSASGALLSFTVVKIYQPYVNLVGEKFVFWTFAVSALSSVVLTYFYVPETKRKTLVDIQRGKLTCEKPKNITP